jgi:hypothetical protein
LSAAESGTSPAPVARGAFFATTAGAAVWVTVVLCLAYLPLFLGQMLFFRDPAHWNYPARLFVREALVHGESPLWNPEQGLGFAVLANPLYGLFYPPHWLFLLTPRALVAAMLSWQAFGHLLLGSLGMVVLARRLRLSATAAGVAGVTWGLSGYITAAWTAGLLLSAAGWYPWVAVGFVALARAVVAPGGRWGRTIAAAAAPLGMAILFGEVFAAAMAALLGVALAALAVHVDGGVSWAGWRRVAAGLAAAGALAGGVGAVVVLPARQMAAATARGQPLTRVAAEVASLHPLRLVEMVAPGSMGYPFADYVAARVIGDRNLDGFPLFYSAYLGAAAVALALAAIGRRRRLPALLGGGALLALLVCLGRHTPVHAVLRAVVRPLAYMRYPEKYLVWLVTLVALLAGLGAARLLDERPAPWRRMLVLMAALLALALAGPLLFAPRWAPYLIWGALKGAVAVALVLAARWLAARAGLRRLAGPLLVAVVSGDLALAAWPYLDFAPRALATAVPEAARTIVADHAAGADRLAPPRLYRADRTEGNIRRFAPAASSAEGELHSMQTLIPNLDTTFGVASLPGYDAAIPPLLSRLWQEGQHGRSALLRLLGVGYTILPVDDPRDPVEHRVGVEPLMTPLPGARLYRIPQPLPRVYLAGSAEVLDDQVALGRVLAPEVVGGGKVLLAPGAAPLAGGAGRAGSCQLLEFRHTRVVARCRADRPAVAVFLEQHDPGWRAQVDGAPVALLRANLVMRAVAVPAGEHVIALEYRAPGLRAGVLISTMSVLLLVALGLLPRRRGAGGRPSHNAT